MFTPTAEQETARDLFVSGSSLAIEAGAGTGKTSTLRLLAETDPVRTGQYVAFNKAIVTDSARTMPGSVTCSTAHALAFRAVGRRFSHRLNGPRMRSYELAKRLGVDPMTIETPFGSKVMQPGYLASLAMRGVVRFCQTADETPGPEHVPYIDGIDLPTPDGRRTYGNNREVARTLAPAMRKAWADLSVPDGQLPYRHDHYLKAWHLAGPRIATDFILFDECQPPWTSVSLAGGGERRIADLEVGDRVVSYTKGRIMSEKFGSVVLGKSVRHYDGELVHVLAGEQESSYTPNHICMARIGEAFDGRFLLYLMRRDNQWRVGVTKARHGSGPGRNLGIVGRLREEGGDAAWVLASYESRSEAMAQEALASLVWRLPQVRFTAAKFWASWDVSYSDPAACAAHFGRDLAYPMIGGERRYMLADRFTEIRASNLMDGMSVMLRDGSMERITTWRRPYSGPVVSLTVSGPATYVADEIVTHNCQDANPVMLAIVGAQSHAQLVFVGDSQQQIYEFTGAVNALDDVPADATAYLTQSFRFGSQIAEVANRILGMIPGATLKLRGSDLVASVVGPVAEPDVVLCRTNATAVDRVLAAKAAGQRPHLVGGGDEVKRFAEAARDLMADKGTTHPDLACFDSWGQVQEYVEQDPSGGELKMLVHLVDRYGVDTILRALAQMPREDAADIIVSTAHKAKGREWDSVQLAGDFCIPPKGTPDDERYEAPGSELRLLYVACTRARRELDETAVQLFSASRVKPPAPVLPGMDPD